MNQSCPECGGDPDAICNFCGNKPPNAITGEIPQKAGEFANEEQRKIFYKDQDPYEAQGKNFRVHHPVQPKTQVERWREERKLNEEAIANCGCRVLPILSNIGDVFDCKKEGTDNCNERFKKIDELQSKILIATQPIHPRYATGEFADDIENAPEYIKKSLFGYNFKKVTLLDKIKLWLKK